MTDLRKAAEMALEALMDANKFEYKDEIAALRQALAQPEQKLIGWKDGEPQYIEQPEPKSISTNDHLCAMLRQVHDVLACTALPMKRPWVGLTEDDVAEVERWVEFKEAGSGQIVIGKLVRYIELKLRSKNNAF